MTIRKPTPDILDTQPSGGLAEGWAHLRMTGVVTYIRSRARTPHPALQLRREDFASVLIFCVGVNNDVGFLIQRRRDFGFGNDYLRQSF
jgi:hypothetical protein